MESYISENSLPRLTCRNPLHLNTNRSYNVPHSNLHKRSIKPLSRDDKDNHLFRIRPPASVLKQSKTKPGNECYHQPPPAIKPAPIRTEFYYPDREKFLKTTCERDVTNRKVVSQHAVWWTMWRHLFEVWLVGTVLWNYTLFHLKFKSDITTICTQYCLSIMVFIYDCTSAITITSQTFISTYLCACLWRSQFRIGGLHTNTEQLQNEQEFCIQAVVSFLNLRYKCISSSWRISQGGSLSHISATHPCTHTSKLASKWRNAHHQILHP